MAYNVSGGATLNEYRKYIEKDAALERRFQPIIVNEPTVEETIQILHGLRDKERNTREEHEGTGSLCSIRKGTGSSCCFLDAVSLADG